MSTNTTPPTDGDTPPEIPPMTEDQIRAVAAQIWKKAMADFTVRGGAVSNRPPQAAQTSTEDDTPDSADSQ